MPEGDTIYRAARTLHRALAGQVVTRFETALAHLAVVDENTPLVGQTVVDVSARGKHVLMRFSGGRILRTHMRMSGSWHVYRPGERWQRRATAARVVIGTRAFEAVAFDVPVAEFLASDDVARDEALRHLGPDLLGETFDEDEAVRRLRESSRATVAEALLDQRAMAGVGNVFKSELLFLARMSPVTLPTAPTAGQWRALVRDARRLLRANVIESVGGASPHGEMRRTTGRLDPRERLWVYGRQHEPCRRCATPIAMTRQGEDNRSTYFCPRCQAGTGTPDA